MAKKLFLVLLLMAALTFVACGGEVAEEVSEDTDTTEEVAEETTEETTEDTAEESEMEEEEMEEEEVAEAPAVDELTILWAQWDPADYLQQIGNMYEEETGIAINIVQEPWGSFQDLFFTEMAAQGTAYDMVVGDSQWIGQATTQGHYLDLTDFMTENNIAETVTEATLRYYGEYPQGSGQYWAYPTEGDALGWAYRQDLFLDPEEQAAFEEEYGYPLAPPETYAQLMDIAKFFTRPDEGIWGAAIYTQADYDALTMGFEAVFFSYGGDWQNDSNEVMGIVNSEEAIAAAEFYKELYECCQAPGLSNAFFAEVNDSFIAGQAAMAMNYFAFLPALINPDVSPYADVTGYFVNPGGPGGEQFSALGGQGVSVVSYISPERQQASKDFIQWFAQKEVQQEWARVGGYTCNAEVLQTEEFLNATPYNPAFAETMTFVKDFWNVPVFGELLQVVQTELGQYVVEGEGTADEAMNAIAEQHQEILLEAGLIEE